MDQLQETTTAVETAERPTRAVEAGPAQSLIRARAFVFGVVLLVVDNCWVITMEKIRGGPFPTIISLFANAVFALALLVAINAALRRFCPRLAFSRAELLVMYTMISLGASLGGHDMIPTIIMFMAFPWRFMTPENHWADTFMPYLPKWLSVTDPNVAKSFYLGGSSLYSNGNWLAWLGPVLNWTAFIVALMFVMMCINTLVRKQWVERERLSFPIVQLPLAMTDTSGELWRNRLFWIGFAIAFSVDLVNGLAFYFPSIPSIAIGYQDHNLRVGLTKPWDAIGWTPYTFYPFVIGLGYLLPADLSFSCWFFYIYWKLQLVVSRAMAWDAIPDFPFLKHQAFGGYSAIIVMLTWTGRGYLKQMWLRMMGRKSELDDSDEPMSYRAAAAGALIGFVFLAWFMKQLGMSPFYAVLGFVIYFILSTSIARMRAELGPPVHDQHFTGPDYMISTSAGLDRLSNGDLVGLTYFYWFNRAYRGHPMPTVIEGMKMAQVTRSSQRRTFWAMMLAALVGTLAAFWFFIHRAYQIGAQTKFSCDSYFAWEAFNRLSSWWSHPPAMIHPNWGANIAMIQGFLLCILLGALRLRVFNFPFHPIGYAISGSWSMNLVWLPIVIAWILKVATLRYGGLRLYKIAVPFFLGLILGGMIIGCLWTILGIAFDMPYYSFWGA